MTIKILDLEAHDERFFYSYCEVIDDKEKVFNYEVNGIVDIHGVAVLFLDGDNLGLKQVQNSLNMVKEFVIKHYEANDEIQEKLLKILEEK